MNITGTIDFMIDALQKIKQYIETYQEWHWSECWQISEYERENKQLRELVKQYVDNDLQNISHEMGVNKNDRNDKHT